MHSNRDIFVGREQHGVEVPRAVYTYANGDTYEGQFKYDQKHGTGVYRTPNGCEYDGEWQYGGKHGKGRLTDPSRGVYTGQWVNDVRHGKGMYVKLDGAKRKVQCRDGLLLLDVKRRKERNSVLTVILRSTGVHNEEYERQKFLEGGAEIKTVLMSNGDRLEELLHRSRVFECEHHGKLKIVIDQHGSISGESEVKHTSEDFTNALKLCAEHGLIGVVFSDLSCNGAATRQLHDAEIPDGVKVKHRQCRQSSSLTQMSGIDTRGETRIVHRCYGKNGKPHRRDVYTCKGGTWKRER